MPKISVITSVFNAEETIKDSVESILGQTFSDFEFIIVDDGSTDNSFDIIERIKDPRIVCLKNESNIGLSASLNRALNMAKGEYVARHDADDFSIRERLEHQAKFLDANPEVGILGGQMEVINRNNHVIDLYSLPTSHGKLAWRLLFDRSFAHPTVMMRREVVAQVAGYDESLRVSQDHQLWTELVRRTRFANLSEVLVRYRSPEGAINSFKSQDQFTNRMRSRKKFASDILGQAVPLTHIRWMDSSQKFPCTLSAHQKKVVFDLFIRLYEAYKQVGILGTEDAADVHSDLVNCLFNVGECSPAQSDLISLGKISGLTWAITHPLKATYKILKIKDYAPSHGKPPLLQGHKKGDKDRLTVIVLTHEREKSLENFLQNLYEQQTSGNKFELIIVNNSPKHQIGVSALTRVNRLIREFADYKILNSSHNWGTPARYAATTLATNETVLFLDDDVQIKDKYLISEMHEAFRSLGPFDILSCWNELWVEWNEQNLVTVSLDFTTPGINEITPTDTIGPGIAMLNRRTILDYRILNAAIPRDNEKPIVSDMGFPLMAAIVHKTRCYYFPAWGKLGFHDQAHKGAIHRLPGRHEALLGLYKELLGAGYQPVLANPERLTQAEVERVTWAVNTLPAKQYRW